MSEARTDTTQERPVPQAAADHRGDDGGIGKHRGGAAPAEDTASPAYGRHRRQGENSRAA
ncbi:hypothetical protein [Streptomyces liangshanensis]|uniref:Uncharacterized protein n=1 Tax=Streptomyces liangshanensis TaxID=2717324 RepID=A0A6G9H3B8_9ACTN|nr:hypothetical protein [Streptomyces liangshanensis]QIQ05032.1 hypothetical protein HA039_24605 [Streptomyces liangshanensis]